MTDLTWPPEPLYPEAQATDVTYDQIFGREFFEEAAKLMDFALTDATFDQFRRGHSAAFNAYLSGQYDVEYHQNERAENAALERVAKDAEVLMNSLSELYGYGETQKKLSDAIQSNTGGHQHSAGIALSDLLETQHLGNPFISLRLFLSDLTACAAGAMNVKPQPKQTPEEMRVAFEAQEKRKKPQRSTGMLFYDKIAPEQDEGTWRARAHAHKLQPNHAIYKFVEAIKPIWEAMSPHTFTQGMHYGELGHTPSRTVSLIKLSFDQHDPSVTPQKITTAIRKVNKAP